MYLTAHFGLLSALNSSVNHVSAKNSVLHAARRPMNNRSPVQSVAK